MRVVVALGGNAILPRGEAMTVRNQRAAIARACGPLASIAAQHELVVTHGNGPQVGLLALQAAAYDDVSEYPFDVLGAQTEGMLGYLIEQELGNATANDRVVATLVTRTVVDPDDPAFDDPSKFVGPVYAKEDAEWFRANRGWAVKQDGKAYRRVVPSPTPLRVLETQPVEWILEHGGIVICAGGGGVPTSFDSHEHVMAGVEAVIDKDRASGVLARDIGADLLIIATDVDGVYLGWGTAAQRRVTRAHPDALDASVFAAGSMRPKVQAAQQFAREGRGNAMIGSLEHIADMFDGRAGTVVSAAAVGLTTADGPHRAAV